MSWLTALAIRTQKMIYSHPCSALSLTLILLLYFQGLAVSAAPYPEERKFLEEDLTGVPFIELLLYEFLSPYELLSIAAVLSLKELLPL